MSKLEPSFLASVQTMLDPDPIELMDIALPESAHCGEEEISVTFDL